MRSPTPRLVAGLVFTLGVIGAWAAYTLRSVHHMREVQSEIVDRNRRASLQLLRIQNDLNALGLAMRDMLDSGASYPITAWKAPLARIRQNLEDAIAREAALAPGRSPEQTAYLQSTFDGFWRDAEAALSQSDPAKAARRVRTQLEPRREAMTALIARLLIANNEEESRAAGQVESLYAGIERNAWLFLGASIVLLLLMSVALIRANRSLFTQVEALADQRRELARQLISSQESIFRAISRDLHDEFGQILTAVGAMLRRANREAPDSEFRRQILELSQTVQATLDNIRSLSQSLQPVILEEQGLLAAIEWHVAAFERQTGIRVHYSGPEETPNVPVSAAIHVFRILQESLNNVARHASVEEVSVTARISDSAFLLTVEDHGAGMKPQASPGVGLTVMRERSELIGAEIEVGPAPGSGTRVQLRLPLEQNREVFLAG